MLSVMLCGASDTHDVREQFAEVVVGFGAEPLHYLSGGVLYQNSADSSWQRNSRMTVHAADLCIFVIIEKFGDITFGTELRAALAGGKPFIILCLERTYSKYLTLREYLSDPEHILGDDNRKLVTAIREMEFDWQLTVTTFTYATFNQILRRETAKLFQLVLQEQQEKSRRAALGRLLLDPGRRLSFDDLAIATRIATDEMEDKILRKQAIMAITENGGADEDTVLALIASGEQGVQRLAAQRLDSIYQVRPPNPDFMAQCVHAANESDDVGIIRRMIPSLLKIDLATAVDALLALDFTEIGTRRRAAEHLERHETEIVAAGLSSSAASLLARCLEETAETGWKDRCRRFYGRLAEPRT